jgi:hypothetical protein
VLRQGRRGGTSPRLVDPRFITIKRAKPLRLLFVLGGFPEIARVALNHSGYMVGVRTVWAEGNRLCSGNQRIIMAALKQASIAYSQVR